MCQLLRTVYASPRSQGQTTGRRCDALTPDWRVELLVLVYGWQGRREDHFVVLLAPQVVLRQKCVHCGSGAHVVLTRVHNLQNKAAYQRRGRARTTTRMRCHVHFSLIQIRDMCVKNNIATKGNFHIWVSTRDLGLGSLANDPELYV